MIGVQFQKALDASWIKQVKQSSWYNNQILNIVKLIINQQFYSSSMNRTRPYLNKFIKQKQLQITDTYHNLNMKQMKPITSKLMEHTDNIVINNSKRQKINEVRQIEIERQNRLLLEKISTVMNKKSTYSKPISKNIRTKLNHSLNQIFRRKQEENITQENKRFLARLQSKKPTLNIDKLNRDWKDNKSVIKRMANFQFYLTTYKSKDNHHLNRTGFNSERTIKHKIQSVRIQKTKVIDGHKMMIKIWFQDGFLKITGDTLNSKGIKVIDIPKEEAIIMIEHDCQGNVEKIIDKLKYDVHNDTIFILTTTLEEDHEEFNPQASQPIGKSEIQHHSIPINLQDKKSSIDSHHLDKPNNKSTIKSNKHQSIEQKVEPTATKIEPQSQLFEQEEEHKSIKKQKESISHDKALVQQKELPLQGKSIVVQPAENENYKEQFEEIKQTPKQQVHSKEQTINN